jgi:hypothetical protein
MNRHLLRPDQALMRAEFFTLSCGACNLHQLKPDKSGHFCMAGSKQYPEGTEETCGFFTRKLRKRKDDAR